MQQRLLYILIGLMSISLAGIIAVQIYWIVDSINSKEEQFSFAVKQVLVNVANEIESQEIDYYFQEIERAKENLGSQPDSTTVRSLLLKIRDASVDETIIYSNSVITEDHKLSAQFLDIELDSIPYSKLINRRVKTINHKTSVDGGSVDYNESYEHITQWDDMEKRQFSDAIKDFSANIPITQRVTNETIIELLEKELKARGVDTAFEYAIYQDNFPTRIQSKNFNLANLTRGSEKIWQYPIFKNDFADAQSYDLYLSLPGRRKFIMSSVWGMALLSFLFTLIIVIAYSSAISQLFKQRQISQIKSDFINNMTHEFKTPIATINLALDSLKHPKINSDPEKVDNYLRMIREENKRMHSQVENVLRISKLDKNDLDIEKDNLDLHDVLEDSISHIMLILEQRSGSLKTHFNAQHTTVLANESHLSNVFVNILENAIKYTEASKSPVIDVYTENARDNIIIKIKDQGIGMTKVAQRKVFQKFFREHTGNIHNVKGHGLGLAYAKSIVDDHHGEVYVESVKGQGSTFTVKLPLIN